MATPVSNGALNLSASGAPATAASFRNAANVAPDASFSGLLLGQFQNRAGLRAAGTSTQANPAAAPVRTSRELAHDSAHAAGSSSSAAAKARTQHPAREAERTARRDGPPASSTRNEKPEKPDRARASAEANPSGESKAPDAAPDAAQAPDAAVPSDAAATIAALLSGIAAETRNGATPDESAPETAGQDALAGRARHPAAANGPAAQTVETEQRAAKNDAVTEDGEIFNPKAPAQDGDPRHSRPSAVTDTGKPAQGQLAAVHDTSTTAAARINATEAAAALASRADSGGRSALGTNVPANAIPPMPDIPRPPAPAGAPQFTIPAGAGQRAWAEEIGNRVMWMLGRAESRAELILTPPHLGKVEVSIHLNGDQGTAQFLASTQAAREALEQAMPRLRELLAQAGIALGQASVNTSAEDRANGEESAHRASSRAPGGQDDSGNGDAPPAAPAHWARLDIGLVDTFA